jgi:hypothetical protein
MLRIYFKSLAHVPRKALSNLGGCAKFTLMGERMVTSKEIAQRFGVSNSTARGWLLRGRFAGAELRESELGQPYWVAPEASVKNFVPPKPGPVPKAKPGQSNGKKRGKK